MNSYYSARDHGHAHAYIFRLIVIIGILQCFFQYNNVVVHGFTTTTSPCQPYQSFLAKERQQTKLHANNARENEIRKKIMQLKKEGRMKASEEEKEEIKKSSPRTNSSVDQYAGKLRAKMGKGKSKLLSKLKPELSEAILSASLSTDVTSNDSSSSSTSIKDDGIDDDDDFNKFELDESEKEMLEMVEKKLLEKTASELELKRQQQGKTSALGPDIDDLANKMEEEIQKKKEEVLQAQQQVQKEGSGSGSSSGVKKTTTGIGGTWDKNVTSEVDTYRPANGGWGYFPRPKDISRAYGGGKRIERTTTAEDERRMQNSVNETRDRLRQYREKVGIEVQSEKDHEKEINQALEIGQLAMQRGIYSTAVSALEKVTRYCSTNSKVGGKVFLELAMAYEAVGRTSEAIQVYNTLSNSRMEDIKFNAKRLLYGIESMQFMRDEMKSEAFSKQAAKQTFIDTTGLGNIAQNFDEKIYNTAYVDLDRGGGFYRKLTESVVRSIREARQILLAATDSGEVDRIKVIQALRSIDRKFNEVLKEEIKRRQPKDEPVAVMNGKPIIKSEDLESTSAVGMDTFNIGDIEQTLENVSGEWKLQLIADSKGDGVNYYNKTLAWQYFDTNNMSYDASGPSGFLRLTQSGKFDVDETLRIITRKDVKSSGSGAFWTDLVGASNLSGPIAATNLQQQIISVDSEMLITRAVVEKKSSTDTLKGYFNVWRRAETGSYSRKNQ